MFAPMFLALCTVVSTPATAVEMEPAVLTASAPRVVMEPEVLVADLPSMVMEPEVVVADAVVAAPPLRPVRLAAAEMSLHSVARMMGRVPGNRLITRTLR
jgi:hypothetical protein